MRWDELGLFWEDVRVVRVAKIKVKREPPEPVWLRDDYLPDLETAKAYTFDLMSDAELIAEAAAKNRLVWDIETYPNYFLLGFKSMVSGKLVIFEFRRGETLPMAGKLLWIFAHFTIVGFNDTEFDLPVAAAALAGLSTDQLMECVNDLIFGGPLGMGLRSWEFYRNRKLKAPIVDHIDLIELTPLGPSLKTSAGRLHVPRMQDLPFVPGKELTEDQITILRWYWVNDLDNTQILAESHATAIKLREQLTADYGVDVRSKSDPQIAEAVIRKEIQRIDGRKYIKSATIEPGRTFRFMPPAYLNYQTPTMQWVLDFVRVQDFIIDMGGSPRMSEALSELDVKIGDSVYRMGAGGLHSQEKRTIHVSNEFFELSDNDVTSYYPELILQQGMFPPQVGRVFLDVFRRIVQRRIAAKRAGDAATAETLKIVVNGTFGKTGERGGHSVVYYPEMMIQVTLSGQLAILMLIEALEMSGIAVVSANTDGIVIKCPRHLIELKAQIIAWWEKVTGLGMESTPYKAIYSRDVNNYIAFYDKPKDEAKDPTPFRFAKAIGAYRKVLGTYPLKWNPTCDVCSEAVINYIATGTPVAETIAKETDVRKFIEMRSVKIGAGVKDGIYLGKSIRWYYSNEIEDEIINAKTGNVIPRSKGARPCMTLPTSLPQDIDYEYYTERAYEILASFEPKVSKPSKNLVSEEVG